MAGVNVNQIGIKDFYNKGLILPYSPALDGLYGNDSLNTNLKTDSYGICVIDTNAISMLANEYNVFQNIN